MSPPGALPAQIAYASGLLVQITVTSKMPGALRNREVRRRSSWQARSRENTIAPITESFDLPPAVPILQACESTYRSNVYLR